MSPSSNPAGSGPVPSPAAETVVNLPPRLDFAATRALQTRLAELRGTPVALDGSAVIFAGALGVQVLLAAKRAWSGSGVALTLTASSALRDDLKRLGLLGEFPTLVEVV